MVDQLRVGKQHKRSSHDFAIGDGSEIWYFDLAVLDINESPSSPNTIFDTGGKGGEFGQFTPDHAHLLQRDWGGGRAQEEWEDNTRYLDSRMAWTLIPGRVTPVPQFRYAEGLRFAEVLLPGATRYSVGDDVSWKQMLSQDKYARSFTVAGATNWVANHAELWVRMVGAPTSSLTVEIHGDSASAPDDTPVFSATITSSDFTDVLSELFTVEDTSSPPTLTAGTTYWVVVYSSADDDEVSHWEIGYGTAGTDQAKVNTGASWANTDDQIYVRVRPTDPAQYYLDFEFDGAFYVVSVPDAGTSSSLWINGDRGIADASASTTLEDATKSWTADLWIGSRVRIIRGTGAGQVRSITDNDTDTLTVGSAWSITPDTTSEYVIIGSQEFTDISPSAGDLFDDAVTDVEVANDQVFFAFGSGSGDSVILRMRNNSGVHEFDDDPGSAKADYLGAHLDQQGTAQIWRGMNDTVQVSSSDIDAWGTQLSFGDALDVGDDSYLITNLVSHEGRLWVFKEDRPYYIQGTALIPVEVGLESMAEPTNGKAVLAWKRDLYMAWAYSMEKLYGQVVDDVGPWLNAGLPSERRGIVSAIDGVHAFLLLGIDAGPDRRSSVLVWNEIGYGELYRAPSDGRRIRGVHWQSVPGGDDTLWIDMGGDLVSMTFPDDSLNFTHADNFVFHHEWVLTSSTYDMEAQQLSKLFKDLVLTTENLDSAGTAINVDYQVDTDIGSNDWSTLETYLESPHQVQAIGEGRRKLIRLRFRGESTDADVPAIMIAAVLEGYARIPVKYSRIFQAQTKNLASSLHGQRPDPELFVNFLKDNAGEAGELTLQASKGFPWLDEIEVLVQPPQTFRSYADRYSGRWDGVIAFGVRDA